MKLNISHLLRLLKWTAYACILLMVKFFIIFPLAVLLFHDLYLRLLPGDSSNWVPLDTFDQFWSEDSSNGLVFVQNIKRIEVDYELPKTFDNGISQPIYLRENILYKVDLNLHFYCIHILNAEKKSNLVEFEVELFDDILKRKLFGRKIPIVCLAEEYPTTLGVLPIKQGSSKLELYQKEWLNRFTLEDKVEIGPTLKSIKLVLRTADPTKLILGSDSGIRFRMHFPQGLVNLMLRWRKITYLLGIALFDLIITILFGAITLLTFVLVSKRLATNRTINPLGPVNL